MRWIVLNNWLQIKFTSVSLFKNTKFNRIQSKGFIHKPLCPIRKNENRAKRKSHHTNCTFGFLPTQKPTLKNQKSNFLANAHRKQKIISFKTTRKQNLN